MTYKPGSVCCIKDCNGDVFGQLFCKAHYARWKRHGHPLGGRGTVKESKAKSTTKEYRAWQSMLARTTKKGNPNYKNYGGRGISVCDRWLRFEDFLSDIGVAPSKEHSLERIDHNGNYEPGNCRWATITEQNRNTRCVRLSAEKVRDALRRYASGENLGGIARELSVPYITLYQAVVQRKSWKEVRV